MRATVIIFVIYSLCLLCAWAITDEAQKYKHEREIKVFKDSLTDCRMYKSKYLECNGDTKRLNKICNDSLK